MSASEAGRFIGSAECDVIIERWFVECNALALLSGIFIVGVVDSCVFWVVRSHISDYLLVCVVTSMFDFHFVANKWATFAKPVGNVEHVIRTFFRSY